MTFYGIDPSAETFTASLYHADAPATTFENSSEGVAAFVRTLSGDRESVLVGVENTGVYSERLCYELHAAGVPLVLLDPGAVARAAAAGHGRGPKTDARDAARIAEYARRHHDKLTRWEPHAVVVEQIRVLLSTREHLVRQRTAAQNARSSLRRKVVQTPGANTALEGVAGYLKTQIHDLEAEIARLISTHPTLAQGVSLLVSVPGVGLLLASQMLVLTSGFEDLPGYRKLAHRLGIAPHPHTSGTSVRRPDRSRRYGPRVMRKLLHLAARSVRVHEPRSRRYFEEKVAAGKPTRLVLNNLANRVLRVMCAVLESREPYRPGHVSLAPVLLTSHRQSG